MSPIRSPGTIALKFRRPASTGRSFARATSKIGPGHEAKIELNEPIDGRKRFKGVLEGFEDGEVRIKADTGEHGIQHLGLPVHLISDAKLVLTDELIREALQRAKERHSNRPGDGAELDEDDLED